MSITCWISLVLMLSSVVVLTDSCSSTFGVRKTKLSVEPTATITPGTIPTTTLTTIMTDQTQSETTTQPDNPLKRYKHVQLCEGDYATNFCLNGGTCYSHNYSGTAVFVCECAGHYHGSRCEEKAPEDTIQKPGRSGQHAHRRHRRSRSTVSP